MKERPRSGRTSNSTSRGSVDLSWLMFANHRSATGQPANPLARLSSRRREKLEYYQEVEPACNAGGFPAYSFVVLSYHSGHFCIQAEKEGTHLGIANPMIPRADSYSRSVMVGCLAAADAKKVGMSSSARIRTLRQSSRNRQDRLLYPLHHPVRFLLLSRSHHNSWRNRSSTDSTGPRYPLLY